MSVFKAYDVRGTYPDQIDLDLSYRIGRAFADYIGKGPLVVGHDMRTMAVDVQQRFIAGILDAGVDVIDIGLASTPQVYYAVGSLGASGGAAVTASHNPAQYIGFKVTREEAIPISGDTGLKDIEELATTPETPAPRQARGTVTRIDTLPGYLEHVLQWADLARPVRIASDAANGMAAHTFPSLLARLPQLENHGLYFELDGTFPNHEANPLKHSNLVDLQAKVKEVGAELGAAFDGDSDRCCFIDETGRPLGNDIITTLVAREVLKQEPGAAIVYDLRSSWVLPETVLAGGGRPVKERVGHSFLKERMREHDAPFGGELSGHYYFRKNWYADNSEIILLCVLSILTRTEKTLSQLVNELLCYHSTGEINFEVEDKLGALQRLREAFPDGKIDDLDGVTIAYGRPDQSGWWWVNLRPSNTEPLLRMTLEADDAVVMKEKKAKVIEILGVQPEE
ncbi:MAG: phosphomannomutase/phosphoglucomutase [Planctomycetes bacterium]|nr:phosphomannomutase/phosphoglucomutase [Planctomycetota bacterium]